MRGTIKTGLRKGRSLFRAFLYYPNLVPGTFFLSAFPNWRRRASVFDPDVAELGSGTSPGVEGDGTFCQRVVGCLEVQLAVDVDLDFRAVEYDAKLVPAIRLVALRVSGKNLVVFGKLPFALGRICAGRIVYAPALVGRADDVRINQW